MKLQRLDMENFRGIRKMRIDFHPRLNVFAGENGIGKTTIISALEYTIDITQLNHVTGNERQELESRTIIDPREFRFGEEHGRLRSAFSLNDKHTGI